ncbi:MAG: ribonuclease HII [Clostridia bacterium]|jgi:ribonuclease HII|nr:ribonuclease HII [Clostridia bacterium]
MRKESRENFDWEINYMNSNNVTALAGVDEVGRGPLAGPVVVASVVMPHKDFIGGIKDSKKISEKRREELFEIIKSEAVEYRIESVERDIIDECNILNATKLGMVRAIEEIETKCDLFLVDGNNIRLATERRVEYLVKGDALSYSIGAASILAKVTRDRLMREYDEIYPMYEFAKNKGYGTAAHIEAIKKYGPCPIHRRTFIKNFV